MNRLNLPPCSLFFKKTDRGTLVFDAFRKRYVSYTSEEQVRQAFLHYLVNHKSYPHLAIATEVSIDQSMRKDRADAVIYAQQGKVAAIVECKAPFVDLSEEVFQQASRYNLYFKAPLLLLTNGVKHLAFHIDYVLQKSETLSEIPSFEELQQWI